MCGITGIFSSRNNVTSETIIKMKKTLDHRGPDDSGFYIGRNNNVALGHTRLSIFDLSDRGRQPMSNRKKDIWISFNGEIYNFKLLRKELEKDGTKFFSSSDTEVIIKSYEKWGIECIEKFIGMFAIAIFDERDETLYLVRDRIGVKPLYYYTNNGLLLFGSELRAILKHPEFRKNLNTHAVRMFMKYSYIPSPHTIYTNTYKLEPGHYLVINRNGIKKHKYWDISDSYLNIRKNLHENEILDELEKIMIDSFRLRLLSDVPVGVFLSGGLDSGILTTLLQYHSAEKIKTYTIGFSEQNKNEAEEAKKLANYLGTDHHEYYFSEEEAKKLILKIPEIFDEPFGDNSALPTYLLSGITVGNVKVALSADGGDELFAGYTRYPLIIKLLGSPGFFNFLKYQLTILGNKISLVGLFNRYFNLTLSPEMYRALLNNDESSAWNCISSHFEDSELSELLPDVGSGIELNIFEDYFSDKYTSLDICSKLMLADSKTYLPDFIMTKVDRCSMSVSLEAREPFLDHRLIEFVASLPLEYKLRDKTSKYLLRKILQKYIPDSMIKKDKKGFGLPVSKWLRGNEFREIVNEYLDKDRIIRENILNHKEIARCLENFYSNKERNGQKIWNLLVFQMWKDRWL